MLSQYAIQAWSVLEVKFYFAWTLISTAVASGIPLRFAWISSIGATELIPLQVTFPWQMLVLHPSL